MTHDAVVLNRREAARYVGRAESTLREWARWDIGPPFYKSGPHRQSKVCYPLAGLSAWVAAGCRLDRRGSKPAGMPSFTPPPRSRAS